MKKTKIKRILTTTIIFAFIFSGNFTNIASAKTAKKAPEKESATVQYLNLEWWETFNDPALSNYLQKLFQNNHDLKIAGLRIKEEEQLVKQSIANELPGIQLVGNIERMRGAREQFGKDMVIPNYTQNNIMFPLSANYELDIWGINRNKTKSAKKDLDIVKEEEHAAYISTTSSFVTMYYNLLKCDKLIQIQTRLVELQENLTKLTEKKYKYGKCSIDELLTEQKNLKYVKEEYDNLKKERAILENGLKTMLTDGDVQKIQDMAEFEIPNIKIPNSIPSEIIENRPDYLIAENYLEKTGIDVKIAKRNLLPRFIIFGQFGFNAYSLSSLFNSESILAALGVTPVVDIFSGGRKLAYLKFNKYKYEEAGEYYRKTILASLEDVNNALIISKTNAQNLEDASERHHLENINFQNANKKFGAGASTKLDVIRANEALLESEKEVISYKINSLISAINLYKSTGGQNLYKIPAAQTEDI